MDKNPHIIERILPLFLAIVTTIVVIFLAQMMVQTMNELKSVSSELASMKSEQNGGNAHFKPFSILDNKCITCHSERKYTGFHGNGKDMSQMIAYMQSMPESHITKSDIDRIHESLKLLKCVNCHDEATLDKLGQLKPEQQRDVVRRMVDMGGSGFSKDEANEYIRILQNIQGF